MYKNFIKRIIDILIASILLFILIPFFSLISIAIKIDSQGPAFYKAQRIGKNNQVFTMVKFRTMIETADQIGPYFTAIEDKRITNIGKILRRTSLDELPQIINVLLGQMSLIGPRPYAPQQREQYTERDFLKRHLIKPGITGWAQVNGRSNLNIEQSRNFDFYYIEHFSWKLDLLIILKTIRLIISRKGAW